MVFQERVPILGRRPKGTEAPEVGLDGVLGQMESEFEEFAPKALRAPQRILGSDRLNQDCEIWRETGTPSPCATLETPEQFETRAVSAEQGVGLEDQEGLFPRLKAAGKEPRGRDVRGG